MECLKWCLSVSLPSQHAVLRIFPFTCRITTLHLPAVFAPRAGERTDLSDDDGKGGRHVDKTGYTNCHDDGYKFQVLTHVDTQKTTELQNSPFQNDGDEIGREPEEEEEEFLLFLWSALKSYCVYLFLYFYFFLFTKFLKNSVYNLNLERWRRKEKKTWVATCGGGGDRHRFGWLLVDNVDRTRNQEKVRLLSETLVATFLPTTHIHNSI